MSNIEPESESRQGDLAPGDEEPASLIARGVRGYLIGLVLSIGLTVVSFYIARSTLVWQPSIPIALSVLAVAQMGVHLVFFLHMTSGPIFVRRGARRRVLPVDEVPSYVATRLMSVRAYDARHMMIDAAVCEGAVAGAEITRMFADPAVAYIHLHNAKRGCFSCEVVRAA